MGSSLAVRLGNDVVYKDVCLTQLSLLPVYSCTLHHWRENLGIMGGGSTWVTPFGEMVGNVREVEEMKV